MRTVLTITGFPIRFDESGKALSPEKAFPPEKAFQGFIRPDKIEETPLESSESKTPQILLLKNFRYFIENNLKEWYVYQNSSLIRAVKVEIIGSLSEENKKDDNKSSIQKIVENQRDDAFIIYSSAHNTYGIVIAPTAGEIQIRFRNVNVGELTRATSKFVKDVELQKEVPAPQSNVFFRFFRWLSKCFKISAKKENHNEYSKVKFEESINVVQQKSDQRAFTGRIINKTSFKSFLKIEKYKKPVQYFWIMISITIFLLVLLLPPVINPIIHNLSPGLHSNLSSWFNDGNKAYDWTKYITGIIERVGTGTFIGALGIILKIYIDYNDKEGGTIIQWDV